MTTTNPASEPPRAPSPPDLDPPIDPMTAPDEPDEGDWDLANGMPPHVRARFDALPEAEQARLREMGADVLDSLDEMSENAMLAMSADRRTGDSAAGEAFLAELTGLLARVPREALEAMLVGAVSRLGKAALHQQEEFFARRVASDDGFAERIAGEHWPQTAAEARRFLEHLDAERQRHASELP